MLPRLNQTITLYQTTSRDGFGGITASNTTIFQGRLVEGESSLYQQRGNEAQYDACLHLDATPNIEEGAIIEYNSIKYTVQKVIQTRGLDGNIKFQYCELVIEAGV